jgi:hypothetical protein
MLSTPETNKRIADIEGKVFTRFNDQVKNPQYEEFVWVECKHYCMTDGEYDSEDIFRPDKYYLMSKHGIARMLIPVVGWVYRATEGNTTVMLVEEHGEYKAICLAVLAKFNKLN